MRIRLDTISEGSKDLRKSAYKKLSNVSKSIAELMARIYNQSGKHRFTIDDIRQYNSFGGWRKISAAFYELESRGIGRVKASDDQPYFSANVAALQSLE